MSGKVVVGSAGGMAMLVALAAVILLLKARASHREPASGLGPIDGRLRACPSSPNCVVSEPGADTAHAVEPLPAGANLEATRAALRAAIEARSTEEGCPTAIVADEPTYLRAMFRSAVFGFDDDLELRIDMAAAVVHARSASRVGRSDFGVNRKRVEGLRRAYLEAIAP